MSAEQMAYGVIAGVTFLLGLAKYTQVNQSMPNFYMDKFLKGYAEPVETIKKLRELKRSLFMRESTKNNIDSTISWIEEYKMSPAEEQE
jgi:hypothetical protein